jgi:hypothetical protein
MPANKAADMHSLVAGSWYPWLQETSREPKWRYGPLPRPVEAITFTSGFIFCSVRMSASMEQCSIGPHCKKAVKTPAGSHL